jgi:hypothetical protein
MPPPLRIAARLARDLATDPAPCPGHPPLTAWLVGRGDGQGGLRVLGSMRVTAAGDDGAAALAEDVGECAGVLWIRSRTRVGGWLVRRAEGKAARRGALEGKK